MKSMKFQIKHVFTANNKKKKQNNFKLNYIFFNYKKKEIKQREN